MSNEIVGSSISLDQILKGHDVSELLNEFPVVEANKPARLSDSPQMEGNNQNHLRIWFVFLKFN